MAGLESERLGLVFADRPDIIHGIHQAADTPERIALFNNIASFIADQYLLPNSEPSAKRRRVEVDNSSVNTNANAQTNSKISPEGQGILAPLPAATPKPGASTDLSGHGKLLIELANAAQEELVLLEVKEVSVSIPQRKKYDLCFTKNYLYTKQVGTSTPVQGMVYKWTDVEYVFYAPIPEKQQLQYNYILFPRNTALSATKGWPPVDFEPILFTVPTTAPKAGTVAGYAAATAAQVSDSYPSLMHWAITSQLQAVGNPAAITATDARVFHSMAKQAYRPGEKAVHVKAHRGTKDGFLFFLPNGILWGYKKPLLFIPLDRIVAVSYTNVLQRTFDIAVEVDVSHAPAAPTSQQQQQQQNQTAEEEEQQNGSGVRTEEIVFSMIDHEDYSVIDDNYIQRHGLNNSSMAAGRRAKRQLRENGGKAVQANGVTVAPEDAALERAEEILEEDEEDEEEEDYDPGSEGESEGEGSSSEEDSDEDGEGGEEDDDDDEEEEEDEDGLEEEVDGTGVGHA
ncbi:unnamed protein product [Discula destructiva]